MRKIFDNDCWCFPGDSIELGASVDETAKREVYEKTGIQKIKLGQVSQNYCNKINKSGIIKTRSDHNLVYNIILGESNVDESG